ncbi:MAG: hypothetical protein GTN74_02610 [Proteobacteria bacterium]|nr:hypothetical protein [Pseudomonadota bacterium]NIS68069.1 hypothetical protein [Pseudomonadota bacterium]
MNRDDKRTRRWEREISHDSRAVETSWKPIFDEHVAARQTAGLKDLFLLRNTDNPNEVVIFFESEDHAKAREFSESEDPREAMERAGVIDRPEIFFLDGEKLEMGDIETRTTWLVFLLTPEPHSDRQGLSPCYRKRPRCGTKLLFYFTLARALFYYTLLVNSMANPASEFFSPL